MPNGNNSTKDTNETPLYNKECEGSDKEETQRLFEKIRKENALQKFRSTGTHPFRFDIPENTDKVKIYAKFSHQALGQAQTTTTAYAAYSPKMKSSSVLKSQEFFIHVRSSTKVVAIGNYVVFHVKTNFALPSFDWIIVSSDIILNSGREFGDNIHPETKTFSVVVSPEMSPGFHIIVHARMPKGNQIIADSAYIPVDQLSASTRHKIQFKVITCNYKLQMLETY